MGALRSLTWHLPMALMYDTQPTRLLRGCPTSHLCAPLPRSWVSSGHVFPPQWTRHCGSRGGDGPWAVSLVTHTDRL